MFDHINRWLLKRLRSRRAAEIPVFHMADEGIELRTASSTRLVGWQEINHIYAVKTGQYIGDTLALVFGFSDETVFVLSEKDPAWASIVEVLSVKLPGCQRYATWSVELIASQTSSLEIFKR